VVLDANIIRENWLLNGPSMSVLGKFIDSNRCKLFIPDVVRLEVNKLFREEAKNCIRNVGELKKLNIIADADIQVPELMQLCEAYQQRMNERLEGLRAEVIQYNHITHQQILTRADQGRKPFRASDKGYKDTLIWEGVLSIATQASRTCFITQNYRDFRESKEGPLHPDLLRDVRDQGLPEDSIVICNSIKQFVDLYLSSYLNKLAGEVLDSLKTGQYGKFNIVYWFMENRDSIIEAVDKDAGTILSHEHYFEDINVSYIEDPERIEVGEAFDIENEQVYFDITLFADTTFDFYIYKSDLYAIEDDYPLLDVQDYDWNEYYAWAQMTLLVPIRISIVFDVLQESVEEFEVNGFDEIFGWCDACGAAVINDAAESCYKCGKPLF